METARMILVEHDNCIQNNKYWSLYTWRHNSGIWSKHLFLPDTKRNALHCDQRTNRVYAA
eukprot:9748489-Ditylum_brightwellii.AAC.1